VNEDVLGTGLKFPFNFQPVSGSTELSASAPPSYNHINESIRQILGTRPGERFMNPEFGSKLKDLVFEQNNEVLKGLISHYVTDAVRRWEKRIMIRNVSFENFSDNQLTVIISYRVISTQTEGSLAYPFYRELT